MPKLIDYPRTTYAGAWELSEVVDDTGGKCALDTAARKLNRKVSGSFKAIIGSAVKFGLLTSKRDLLSTTTLFRRIKHAYDKAEELVFHREAFLTPPLFTQVCRKFRSRELPVQMLDVMLIREFGVEEINALGVAKAFTEGARAVGLLDEDNMLADIDQLAARQPPRRELSNPTPLPNAFRAADRTPNDEETDGNDLAQLTQNSDKHPSPVPTEIRPMRPTPPLTAGLATRRDQPDIGDAVETLFATPRTLTNPPETRPNVPQVTRPAEGTAFTPPRQQQPAPPPVPAANVSRFDFSEPLPQTAQQAPAVPVPGPAARRPNQPPQAAQAGTPYNPGYQVQLSGPGLDTVLTIADEADLDLAQALLEKIRRQLRRA